MQSTNNQIIEKIKKSKRGKNLFVISLFLFASTTNTFSQVLRIDNGASFSWTNHSSKKNIAYTGSVGLDYFEKKHFMLTSRIGFLKKGEDAPMIMPPENRFKIEIDYWDFSSTARFKQPVFNGNFFVGLGPSFDFKHDSKYEIDGVIDEFEEAKGKFISEDFVFGFLAETGYFFNITNWRVELNLNYRNNITKIIPETRKGFISNSLALSLGIGYIF